MLELVELFILTIALFIVLPVVVILFGVSWFFTALVLGHPLVWLLVIVIVVLSVRHAQRTAAKKP